jgi:hypothetical protein
MTAIRPDLPISQPVVSGASAQVRAAQAAFFRAALSDAGATQAKPASPSAAPVSTQDESPRLPRPGALLDIRV